ncbi:MAG: 16S rRNA (cytosine(1402)-N(4))-methyltransferase RsmH [Clostridia bacterium]|nr:16S rRNA (cytosine(1402)-N(4))-methyltransferase RsmH [Clostridia bacterium]
MTEFIHKSVLLNECLDGLSIKPDGIYVDGTLGGGGHSSQILKRLTTGRLIGIDRDMDAIRAATKKLSDVCPGKEKSFTLLHGNFHDAKALLSEIGITRVDGVLLDLGVSSYQLDARERGFSYHDDAPLDMRMDASQPFNARNIVNEWDEKDIARILRDYGEENWAVQIARVIADRRKLAPIETTSQLVHIIDAAIPKKFRAKDNSHPARRTFQALRIAVNDELEPLVPAINDFAQMLNPEGRLCIIAFHSLEDRLVKNAYQTLQNPCTCPKQFPVCVCGKKPLVKIITRKPIVSGEEELKENPRARSATLRIAERI